MRRCLPEAVKGCFSTGAVILDGVDRRRGGRGVGLKAPSVRDCPGLGQLAVPVIAGFWGALMAFVIDMHQAKSLGIAMPPFKIIKEGPNQIAPYIIAIVNRARDLAEIAC